MDRSAPYVTQSFSANSLAIRGWRTRMLGEADLATLKALRATVVKALPDPDHYQTEADEDAFLRAHFGPASAPATAALATASGGECFGVERIVASTATSPGLAAYAMLSLPSVAPAHAFFELAMPQLGSAHAGRVAQLASCMVHPLQRGHGLQRALLGLRMAWAQAQGCTAVVAMVSLRNSYSRRNLLQKGLKVAWVGEHEGLQRQVLAMPLLKPLAFDNARAQLVAAHDFERQRQLTSQGWWGVAELHGSGSAGDGSQLVFAQPA
jgi:GNAT superfamily N-acetyltransferase